MPRKPVRTVVALVLFTALLSACGGPSSGGGGTPPPSDSGPSPVPSDPGQPTPYTMKGTVRNAAGQPVSGAEVWADNTLYYNMNALGTTDAQGRYSISLPRDQIGTWQAGGRFKTQYGGQWYDLSLAVDNEAAFATDAGAVRHFTLRISGERPGGGFYGGKVWPYFSSHGGEFEMDQVEYTLTPDGPLMDGSVGQTLKRHLDGPVLPDVPLGRYKVTARYLPASGPAQDMVLMGRDESQWSSSTTIMFRNTPDYGLFADFTVSLAPHP
ncbi:MAG: hypothetical protein JWQ08_1283 [Deinococcus sp.]|nr:hypothetical protein [Deinococcus sp.]